MNGYRFPTDIELLKIFPEAKEIISQKIDEWLRVKGKVFCKEVQPALEKISKVKDFYKLDLLMLYTEV